MTLRILDTPDALAALAADWDALWRRTPAATPFQSPHWLLPWWAAFGTQAPRLATWWQDGTLAGVLPAYVLDEAGGRKLLPMGAGTTDYLDALGEGAVPMLHALLARAASEGVDRCDLIEVPPGSALRDAPAPPGWAVQWSGSSPCPVLALHAIAPSMRRNLRLARNRAARAGGCAVEIADAATLDAGLAALVALHQARWTGQGEPGVLADPAVLRFHARAAPGLLAAGLLRLAVLRLGGTVAAAAMALLDPRRIHIYLSGYDVARRTVSPGTLLMGALLDGAAAEGRTEAHFLRGNENYKYAWGALDRMNATGAFTATRSAPGPHPEGAGKALSLGERVG